MPTELDIPTTIQVRTVALQAAAAIAPTWAALNGSTFDTDIINQARLFEQYLMEG